MLIYKHVLRNLWENKGRTVLMMLSLIFMGAFSAFIISGVCMFANLASVVEKELAAGYDYVLSNKDGSEITEEQLNAVTDNKENALGWLSQDGYIEVDDKLVVASFRGCDTARSNAFGVLTEDGSAIPLEKNETIILAQMAEILGLSVGDHITYITHSGVRQPLTIAATVKNDVRLSYEKDKCYSLAVNPETFFSLYPDSEYCTYFLLSGPTQIAGEMEAFRSHCDELGLELRDMDASVSVTGMLALLYPIAAIIILLLGVVVYFVNSSLVRAILIERLPVMGTFRSVGATAKKVNAILLLEMAMSGLLAGIIGTAGGFFLCRLLISSLLVPVLEDMIVGVDFAFLTKTIDNFRLLIFSGSILLIVLLQVLLSLREIRKNGKMSIKDCIFSKYDDIWEYNVNQLITGSAALLIGISALLMKERLNTFWGFAALICLFLSMSRLLPWILMLVLKHLPVKNSLKKLACESVAQSKLQTTGNIVLSVLLCTIMLLMSAANEILYENKSIERDYAFDAYAVVSSASAEDIADIALLESAADTAVLRMFTPVCDEVYIAENKVNTFMFYSTDNPEALLRMNSTYTGLNAQALETLEDGGIVLSKWDAERYGLEKGDRFYLRFVSDRNDFKVSFPVYVTFTDTQTYSDKIAFISDAMIDKLVAAGMGSVTAELFANATPDTGAAALIDELNQMFADRASDCEAQSLDTYIADAEAEAGTVWIGIVLACTFIALIVLTCVMNNRKISVYQRQKLFASLYSIGMSRRQLRRMIIYEVVYGYLVTALVSCGYSLLLVRLAEITIGFSLRLTLLGMAAVYIILLAVTLLQGRKLGRRIDRMNVVEELKYE